MVDLLPEVEALATALGLMRHGTLDTSFFSDPLARVRSILSNPDQRVALLAALDGVLPSDGSPVHSGDGDTTRHPLVASQSGSVSISVTRSGAAENPDVIVGLWASAADAASHVGVEVDLPLVRASGPALTVVAGSADHPLAVGVQVPLGWERATNPVGLAAVSLSALVLAPPDLGRSRVVVRLHGLDLGIGPAQDLTLDPFDLGPDLAHALTMLVVGGLAQSEAAAQDDVVRLVQHLPGALGLDGQLPLLPLGRLLADPGAIRSWLAALVAAQVAGGTGLHHWVDAVAQLLGVGPLPASASLPTVDQPMVVTLADGGSTGATVQAQLWLAPRAAGRADELHVALEVHVVGPVARVVGRAELLVVPLDGAEPARALTSAAVFVESNAPLLPGAGGPLTVGVGRGGLRWDGSDVVPVLELDHVHVDLPGVVQHPTDFDRLDLSHAKTLAAEAKAAVGDFLTAQLGAGSEASAAVALLGLSLPPDPDALGAFANDPLRFVGRFHRAALDAHTYQPVAQQVVALLGASAALAGSGTSDDPWSAPLAGSADGSGPQLRVTVWDVPSGADHELHVGLQVEVSTGSAPPSCTAGVLVDLLSFRLPAAGPARPALLGRVRADVVLRPSAPPTAVLRADDVHVALDWAPATGLHSDAAVHGLVVQVDGVDVPVAAVGLPDGLTPAVMDAAWPAARLLLARAARSWGGSVGSAVADVLGLARSQTLPSTWPLLELPGGGVSDLLSDPVRALRGRLADLLSAAAAPEGGLPVDAVLDRVRDLLARALPARPDLPSLPAAPVEGTGSYDDPWRVPLTDPGSPLTIQPVELLVWAEPGPPRSWGTFVRSLLDAEEPDLATALDGIRGRLSEVADALAGLEPDTAARWLTSAGQALDGTDGLVTGDQGVVLPAGVTVLGGRPVSAHSTAPQHPDVVAATTSHLQGHGATGLPTLLLAPSFAPDDVWAGLLAGVAADQQVRVDLRVPGVSADVVDLTTVAEGTHYLVDLADDGTPTLDQLATRLHRVVTRVTELTGAAKVGLVGHSIAGVVAAHYAAAHPGSCQAVVTIAAPLSGGGPAVLRDPEAASGVRLARSLLPAGLPLPALDRAVRDLATVLDGWTGVAPTPFPAKAFDRSLAAGVDLSAVPTLAVWTGLEAPLVRGVAATLGTAYDALADTLPTHLGWGLGCDLDLGADTAVVVDLRARADLGSVALSGAAAPAHPAGRLLVDALVHRPDGWLVGSAGTGEPLDVRLRSARIRYDVSPDATELDVTLYDGAVNGSGAPSTTLQDARSGRLTGALVDAVAAEATVGSAARGLMDLLAALELVTFDPATLHATMRADAIDALATDPGGWLGVRAFRILRDQPVLLALTPLAAQAGQPLRWRRPLGSLPVELVVSSAPWTVGLRTTGAGLDLGDGASVSLEALVPLGAAPAVTAAVTAAGVTVDVTVGADGGVVRLSAPPLLHGLQVFPAPAHQQPPSSGAPDAAAAPSLASQLVEALSTTGLAAALSGVVQDALGGALPVGSVVGLLDDPAAWFLDPRRLGDGHGLLRAEAAPALLSAVAAALGLPVEADGVRLADGLHLRTSATATTVQLALSATDLTPAADGPSLDLDLRLDLSVAASAWTVRPGGTAKVTVPLTGGTWPSIAVVVGLTGDDATLGVQPGGSPVIPLLPHFAGLWDLLGGGVKALLPGVLDRLVQDLAPGAPGAVLERVLAVTDALGLRTGAPPSFDSEALAALVAKAASGDLTPSPGTLAAVATAVLPVGAPVTVTGAGARVELSLDSLPVTGTGRLVADLTAGAAPTVELHLDGVVLGPVVADVRVGEDAGTFGFDVGLRVDVPTDLGFDFTPALAVSGLPLAVSLLPLGPSAPLRLDLAPTPGISPDASALGGLLVAWAEPVAARAALEATRSLLDTVLWTPPEGTALTGRTLLAAAGLLVDAGGTPKLVRHLPDAPAVLRGLLAALDVLRIPVTPDLAIGVYSEGSTWLGLGLTGHLDLDAGDLVVSALLGSPEAAWTTPRPGLGLLLLDDSAGLVPRPGLRLGAVGIGVRKKAGPLVDSDVVQLHDVAALVQASLDLSGPSVVTGSLHAGVRLGQIGLPMGGSSSPANAIAASLLKPSGNSGDDKPATPPVDLSVLSSDSGSLSVQINAKAVEQPFFFDIHKTFGPLHIDRIGLQHLMMGGLGDGVAALVDGGVAIAGLTVDVQGLTLAIPLKHPAELNLWDVDLAGLAMSFSAGPVSIEGGLLKSSLPTGIEYDGMVKVEVGSFGLTALAGYAKATGDGDTYTSLFVFVVVDAPLGGPPFLFVTGLAGGAGYNRQLVVPADPAVIPTYPLVRAMSEGVGSDPMGALHQMSKAMPPRRGSYWVAAGVKFTTFGLINTKALAYVALDRGFEVGLMGLMTMALPTPDEALVSVELALLARYSTADQLLALRAQLTNNSWLISKDCQLTGGFAFYSWFGDKPSVLLTIGGTGPNWIPDPVHPVPDVPPVGFHWSVGSGVVVKGESYFAITPRQLAFGGRLEATGEFGPVRVWFEVHLNVDIEWDPLHYHLDAGISIGAELRFTIDLLFTSITIDITISIGGSVVVEGPPLHGSVTVDLEIASVTVDFGHSISPPGLSWPEFAAKFVGLLAPPNPDETASGETSSIGTISYGQLADSTKGPGNAGEHPDGSKAKPWKVLPEFGIDVASQLPLTTVAMAGRNVPAGADPRPPDLEAGTFSIKPMGSAGGLYSAHLEIQVKASGPAGWTDVDVSGVALSPRYGHYPTAVWLVGGKEPPPQHRDMWLTVSGAGLAFPVTLREASGALGDAASIPVATLVEELPQRPLPFTSAPHALRHTELPVPERAPAEHLVAEPRLLAATHRQRPAVARSHRIGTTDHGRLAALAGAVPSGGREDVQVGVGEAHVWASPYGGGAFEGRGEGDVRVTTLSATGHVLDDRSGSAGSLRFDTHPHGHRVVVSGLGPSAPDDGIAGWQSGSVLTQVAGDTLLGQGCVLLLPRKVTAPHPAMTERRVRAARVTAGLAGVQTLLPADVDVVVVLLDELTPGTPDDLVVLAGTGHPGEGVLGPPREVREGSRRCLVYPVQERPAADRLAVTVASARGWRTAGVLGAPGDLDTWAARLAGDPHPRLLAEGGDGGTVGYALTSRRDG